MERIHLRDTGRVKAVGRLLRKAVNRVLDESAPEAPGMFAGLRRLSLTRSYEAVARMLGWDNYGSLVRTAAGWRGPWSVADEDLPPEDADRRHAEQGAALRAALADVCGHDFGPANCAAAARIWHASGRQPPFDPPDALLTGYAAWLDRVSAARGDARWPLRYVASEGQKATLGYVSSLAEAVAALRALAGRLRAYGEAGCVVDHCGPSVLVHTTDPEVARRLGMSVEDEGALAAVGLGPDRPGEGAAPPAGPAAADPGPSGEAWFAGIGAKGWLPDGTPEEMAGACDGLAAWLQGMADAGVRLDPDRSYQSLLVLWTGDPGVAARFGFRSRAEWDDEPDWNGDGGEDATRGLFEPGEGANTRVEWLYRDADNMKASAAAVLAGRLTRPEVEEIVGKLDEGEYLIPGQVGLDDLQGALTAENGWSGADHPWHELVGIGHTDDAPTLPMAAAELLDAFRAVEWDDGYEPPASRRWPTG